MLREKENCPMDENKLSFEEAFAKLDEAVRKLCAQDTSLEDAMKSYEEGLGYYKQCRAILDEAKQKIELFKKEEQDEES